MIQVLNKAFDILEFIAREPNVEYGLGEIADSLKFNHGTCANIIKTMISREYIEQMGRRGNYRLGSKVYYLIGNPLFKKELLDASVNIVKELSFKLNEGTILAIVHNNKRIIIHEEFSNHELQVVNKKAKELYETSTGRVILAFRKKVEQETFVSQYGIPTRTEWPGINNEEDFYKELQKIRKNKISVQESPANIVGIAAPIFIKDSVVASLGVYLPESRFSKGMKRNIFSDIINSALRVTEKLDQLTNIKS